MQKHLGSTRSRLAEIRGSRHVTIFSRFLHGLALAAMLSVGACATLPREWAPPPEQTALPPASSGSLAETEARFTDSRPPGLSGFHLLDENAQALRWRLALIDEAETSLDLMYYLWYADDSGRLLLSRAIAAAERGVKVRFIVDDMLLIGVDKVLVALEQHPNIQFRVFNPWRNRKLGMGIEFIGRMGELNTRMHNKLLIADNRAMIAGGRNIGDHYFGQHGKYNFHDLDVLGVGPIAREASDFFDSFWNSPWVVSAAVLPAEHDPKYAAARMESMLRQIQEAESLSGFETDTQSWDEALSDLAEHLRPGAGAMVFDRVEQNALIQEMPELLGEQLSRAKEEILLVNAYIIPGQPFIDGIRRLHDSGVHIRILTNSLSSNDVPAVNSHYKRWRKPIIGAGAELYEFRSDPAIKPLIDTAPVVSKFSGLHTKAFVVDRQSVFIGSMNFDPRSININTEMGLAIDSRELAQDLVELAERNMSPDNAWQVTLDGRGHLIWTNAERTVSRQPAQNAWQRFMDAIFRLLPASQL